MKKVWKGFAAAVSAAAIAATGFIGATSAYAAPATDADGNYTITMPSQTDHTYEVYQIFVGTLNDDGTVLSDVKWGKNGTGTEGAEVADTVLNALTNIGENATDTQKLAVIEQYVNLESMPFAGPVDQASQVKAPAGYYLVKDTDDSQTGKNQNYTKYIVAVANDLALTAKATTTPTPNKEIMDINDTTETPATGTTGNGTWGTDADWDMGDQIPFRLSATLPASISEYNTYKLTFHDSMDTGLTLKSDSFVVKKNGTAISANAYTIVTSGLTDGDTFEVRFADVKAAPVNAVANDVITVEYTAALNENAVLGADGNWNRMTLEFSNNPNTDGEGDTGTSEEFSVVAFTFQTVVNKVDNNNQPLTGAEFTLQKHMKDGTKVTVGHQTVNKAGTTFTWKGLDDGTYTLSETKVPNGYNKMKDVTFTITTVHGDKVLTSINGNAVDGVITLTPENDKNTGLTTTVVNKQGSNLPETGGMGTTVLYVAGAAIVLIAGIGLAVALRRRQA